MPISAILGYVRAFARGPTIEEQHRQLIEAGVEARFVYADDAPAAKPASRRMFGELLRALRRGDVLAVPTLASFARNHAELRDGLAGLETRGVQFWSIGDDIDTRRADPDQLYKLTRAERRAIGIWNRERTLPATQAARRSGRSGPRPKLSKRALERARLAWGDAEGDDAAKSNKELATEHGLSPSRLHALFGARPERG